MLRKVTWRMWVAIAVMIIFYMGIGIFLIHNDLKDLGRVEDDIYTWGLVLETIAPIAFVLVLSRVSEWWRNDVGTNLVLVELGLVPQAGILAYAFMFNHGQLNNLEIGWAWIGSSWWLAGWLLWRNYLYLRVQQDKRQEEKKGES